MKNIKNKKMICLIAAAVVMVLTLSVGSAMAYFSTYVVSEGSKIYIQEFTETELDEEISAGMKKITIKNVGTETGDGAACFVRVKFVVADKYAGNESVNIADNPGWSVSEGFYYYDAPLMVGDMTTELVINIDKITEDFNVVVIQENTPALYDEKGEPYADWDRSEFVVTNQSGETVSVKKESVNTPEEE